MQDCTDLPKEGYKGQSDGAPEVRCIGHDKRGNDFVDWTNRFVRT